MTRTRSSMNKGFSLVEVMVALTAGTLIMILVLASFHSLSTYLTSTGSYRKLHKDVRYAVDLMQRDITRSSNVTRCTPSSRLELITSQTGSGSNQVSVVYSVVSNYIFRTENSAPAERVASDVAAVTFSLYDKNAVSTSDPADAYFVGIELEAETQAVLNTYEDRFQTRVRMRAKGL